VSLCAIALGWAPHTMFSVVNSYFCASHNDPWYRSRHSLNCEVAAPGSCSSLAPELTSGSGNNFTPWRLWQPSILRRIWTGTGNRSQTRGPCTTAIWFVQSEQAGGAFPEAGTIAIGLRARLWIWQRPSAEIRSIEDVLESNHGLSSAHARGFKPMAQSLAYHTALVSADNRDGLLEPERTLAFARSRQ